MKAKSALKESQLSIRVGLVFIAALVGITFVWTNWFTLLLLAIGLFGVVGDVINVVYIRRRAKKDPTFLEAKIK